LAYNAGRYSRASADDYDDYQIAANGLAVFSARTDLKLHAEYLYGHDSRGSTDRPSAETPDEYANAGAEATFGYGAPGARGRRSARDRAAALLGQALGMPGRIEQRADQRQRHKKKGRDQQAQE